MGSGGKRTMVLGLCLLLAWGSFPANADDSYDKNMERCLEGVKKVKKGDSGPGVEGNILIFVSAALLPEIFATCKHEYDAWLF